MTGRSSVIAAIGLATVLGAGAAGAESVVRYEGDRMFVDGRPFLPFGVMWFDVAHVPLIAELGLNIVYANVDEEKLDRVAEAGLTALAAIRSPGRTERLSARPEIVAWFVMDDAKEAHDVARCAERTSWAHAIGDGRPVTATANGRTVESDAPIARTLDVYWPYAYPFPVTSIEAYGALLEELRRGLGRDRFWTTIQSSGFYSKNRKLGLTDPQLARMLDPAQLRLLVYTAIRHGARGIFFWPEFALFNDRGWGLDCRGEVGRIAHELEIIGPHLVRGIESADARADHGSVRVTRIDDEELTLLVLTRVGPADHLAVDGEVSRGVRVSLGGLPGDARAYRIALPSLVDLGVERSPSGETTIVIDEIEIASLVVVTNDDAAAAEISRAVSAAGPDGARFAADSAHAFVEKARGVLDALWRLGAMPDRVRSGWTELDPGTFDAESARRHRKLLFACRAHADAFATFAAPEAAALRLSPLTLPAFFSSFDLDRARERLEGSAGGGN